MCVCLSTYYYILSIKLLTYVLHTRYSMFHFILRFSSEIRERNKQIHSDWKKNVSRLVSFVASAGDQKLKTEYQISLFWSCYLMFHSILQFSSETRERNKQIHSDWKQKCLSSCFFCRISRGLKTKYQIRCSILSFDFHQKHVKEINKFIQIEKNVSNVSFVASAGD